ncbi:MAG: hypothetical protein SF069_15685 [Phycisphaerae bacterium]|nr:hypothetical protein [Phycisphaerae bacterium]
MAASPKLRNEALGLLNAESDILRVAREICEIANAAGVPVAVIGGVAVVLHGHVRTTLDVDVFVGADAQPLAEALRRARVRFDAEERQFTKRGVPVHLVREQDARSGVRATQLIEGVCAASLADIINMKLRSGLRSVVRAQDIADVIGLVRAQRLGKIYAAKLDRDLRVEFRKLVDAVQRSR